MILIVIGTKQWIGVTILLITIAAVITGVLLGYASSNKENIKDDFYKSVNYDPSKGILSFTIPKSIPKGYKFYLHISGRLFMGDKASGMSFHAFDKESLSYTWIKGKTYTYPLNPQNLDFILIDYGLLDKKSNDFLYEYTIRISPDGTRIMNKIK